MVAFQQCSSPCEHPAQVVKEMRAQTAVGRREAEAGPRGKPAVHAGDAVVPGTQKAGHGLKIDQREDPVVRHISSCDRLLDVVILRRDENVEIVGVTARQR